MSASFEHSAMKSSFSLSSLRSAPAPPGGRCDQLERPYHSLTKKRKEPCREAWRRSWGSAASGGSAGDDLWPLLQHHYDYIMDNQIIDSCREANGELLSHNWTSQGPRLLHPTSASGGNRQWSLNQLVAEFTELCQWLTHVQEEIYSSPENLSSRKLRKSRMAELVSVEHRRVKFVEQASAILDRIPEAAAEVTWRMEHLNVKWESLRLLLSPEQQQREGDCSDTVDPAHELRCLRRWLHVMEGRLPPPSLAARAQPYHDLLRKLREHQVLQRDVECHGRIVSSVVRLCGGGDAARALERRWHLLYLRAIEWQCHLEACLAKSDNQGCLSIEAASDSDEEPALKQPRLCRGSPRRRTPQPRPRNPSLDSRQSASEEEGDDVLRCEWRSLVPERVSARQRRDMDRSDEHRVPDLTHLSDLADLTDLTHNDVTDGHTPPHSRLNGLSTQETESMNFHEEPKTPPTVVKRKKPVDTSKFNQTDRKSKNCATFYFRHHDTDSDGRQMVETDEKSQESSEEEWTYVGNPKIANEDSTDLMTSSVEIQCELTLDEKKDKPSPKPKLESSTPDLLKVEARCKDIERLVIQAEELVQKQAQHQMAKKKNSRNFKSSLIDEEGKAVSRGKMSRIKEWLNQSTEEERAKNENNQCTESYDASGEYTTESEVDTSLTSEERNLHSSMDMSTSTCTVTPTHQAKVQLRKKRCGPRPWSVSCLSQLAARADIHNMSISESALNTLASPQRVTPAESSALRGSSTTVQGHVSSTNTMTEACTSCVEAGERQCWARRKRLKLRKHADSRPAPAHARDRLVKSRSFCGRLSPEMEDGNERSAASDPATSRKNRFDTTSTSGNETDEELIKQQLTTIANLRRSIEKTHITTKEDSAIPEQNEPEVVIPSFKLGPEGGPVRPRMARSSERERSFLALSLGDPSQLWDLSIDRDSDIDKSVTAGTEEHSSFSEQAWDFYQEKYNSEPYSEAPDSDGARRLLEFGDDYLAFIVTRRSKWSCDKQEFRSLFELSFLWIQTEIIARCRENINMLDAALADGSVLSSALQRDIRAVSARWSALRAAALRRGGARRLRREIAALRETLDDVCEPGDCAPQPHTRAQLNRRIDELKERLSRLLECKVSMLKLTVSVRRTLGEGADDSLTEDLTALLAAWDDAHQRTSNELLSLEKAVSAWAEWESALRELQGALRGDMATLQSLRGRSGQTDLDKIRQLAASLVDKKKGGSTCDSLSDSGISDGDSEAAGGRARRLCALRELARRLQAALAPASPAHRAIAKRMEQTENEVKTLQESCRALVEQSIPDLKIDDDIDMSRVAGSKTGAGEPEYRPRGWVWRVLRSSLPIQLCLVALLLAAWLVERPRCCDALNSLAHTLTPQLRYVRGPPPV
ncbi:PREDICTED: uncharacterized protein LOC106104041 [Papilio polytes]|uniref:uncharacterized protein LOC106104041 n=1 Tax=Papilio polytes TaxID=76194 RepID=UPI00067663EB|nr:PREDICTED: uncharacterized protein LOC106104041 [Papilio polytes]